MHIQVATDATAREAQENLPLLRYCNVIQQDVEALQRSFGLDGSMKPSADEASANPA